MADHKLVTHTYSEGPYKIIITQNYAPEFNFGHYQYAIFDGEHIVSANHSYGSPHDGIADDGLAKWLLSNYVRQL